MSVNKESTGYSIVNKILQIKENFEYKKDFIIEAVITGMKAKDSFNNYPYTLQVKVQNQTIVGLAIKNATIFANKPKPNNKGDNDNQNGPSIVVCNTAFEGTFLELMADIQRKISAAVAAYNSTISSKPGAIPIKPYYSDFDFESPKWIQSCEDYRLEHQKEKVKYDKGLNLQVYFDKKTNVFGNAIKEYPDPTNTRVFTYLTGPEKLTKSKLREYGQSEVLVNKTKQYNIFNNIYGKSYAELMKLDDDKLSNFNELVTKDTIVDALKNKTGMLVMINFSDVKSNLKRNYSSWKAILNVLYVTPRISVAESCMDACEQFLEEDCVPQAQSVHVPQTQVIEDDEIED